MTRSPTPAGPEVNNGDLTPGSRLLRLLNSDVPDAALKQAGQSRAGWMIAAGLPPAGAAIGCALPPATPTVGVGCAVAPSTPG